MTVAELKTELKKLDLSQAGKKADLVERLSGALGGGRRLAESAGASCAIPFGETPYTPLPPPPTQVRKAELRTLLHLPFFTQVTPFAYPS